MSVPKLRFPEFWDAGEWEEKKLIDVTDKKVKWSFIGGPFGSNLKSSDYTTHGIRVIQLQNIGDAEFLDNYKIFTSEQKANELLSCNIYPDEIILSKMGDPVGRACLIPNKHERYLMCSDGIRLVVDDKLFSKYFIYSLINSDSFRKLLEKTATGSTRKRIGLDDLRNLPMVLPKIQEQQKIADCLSSIDDRITAETQKLDTLKAHKKGLMQQLFPVEGETLPKLRFPEFRDAGEWEERKLGELANFSSGGTPSKDISEYWNGNIPWISASSMYELNIWKSDLSITELGLKAGSRIAKKGSLLILVRGSMLHKRIPLGIALIDVAFNQDIKALSFIGTNINKCFLLYQLIAMEAQLLDMVSATGLGAGKLDTNELKQILVYIPNFPEQQKIADCLSSIDEAIAAQSQAIDLLKLHKKGLMQQLFPSVEEVRR